MRDVLSALVRERRVGCVRSRSVTALMCSASVAAFVFHAQPADAQSASFTNLGTIGGDNKSAATDISADGTVVIGHSSTNTSQAFRWSQGTGMVGIASGDFAGALNTFAYGVNADGSVIVGGAQYPVTFEQRAYRWTASTGMQDIRSGDFASSSFSIAVAVSADGSAVAGSAGNSAFGNFSPFRWTASTGMVNIQGGGFITSSATSISADGSVIVGTGDIGIGLANAFRWTAGTGMVNIHDNAYVETIASRVSANGQVIIGQGDPDGQAVYTPLRWTQATGWVSILSGDFATTPLTVNPRGLNADGSVIVGSVGTTTSRVAFRWSQTTGMRDLTTLMANAGVNMSGIALTNATGVSANGEYIVGNAATGGSTYAFLARYNESTQTAGVVTPGGLAQSVNNLSDARAGTLVQQQGFAAPLLGANNPMAGGNEVGAYASAGSASAGGHARYSFGNGLTALGGIAFATEDYPSASLKNSFIGAGALRYVLSGQMLQPFVEGGGWITPGASLEFSRAYQNGAGTATGVGNTRGDLSYYYGRAGVLLSASDQRQLVLSGELGRQDLRTRSYVEKDTAQNPFGASVSGGNDAMTVTKLRASASQAFTQKIDATLWGAWAYGFDRSSNVTATMVGVGTLTPSALGSLNWFEYGVRTGYRLSPKMTLEAFANGVTGEGAINTKIHAGAGLRAAF